MKKAILFLLISLISNCIYSQSFEETAKWISNNTKGSVQVTYDKQSKFIEFISVRSAGNLQTAFVKSFNPKNVVSIATLSDKYGKYSIRLNFIDSGTLVTSKMYDDNYKVIGTPSKVKMYGFDIDTQCDKDMVERHKKAIINLFKQIGVSIKNGDLF